MMEGLGQYVLSVVAAGLILGILKGISGNHALMNLAGGLFLTFVIVQPLADFDFTAMTDYIESFSAEGTATAAMGEAMGDEAYRSVIKAETEAYILDKAESLGAVLTVSVTLNEDAIPETIRLQGGISPYAKARLEQMMQEELGISKENQLWIG